MKYFLSYKENEKTKQVSQEDFESKVNEWIEDGYLSEIQIVEDSTYAITFDNLAWFHVLKGKERLAWFYVLNDKERQDFDELVVKFKQVMRNYDFDSDLLHDLIDEEE